MAVTIEQLQQELAALKAQVDGITAPPTDYYTSRWSGEEIDNGVARALPGGAIDTDLSKMVPLAGNVIRTGITGGTLGGGCASIVGTGNGAYLECFTSLDDYALKRSQLILHPPSGGGPLVALAQTLDGGKSWTTKMLATTSQLCNPNLLDNWYFAGGGGPGQFPVNQRGQTHYDVTGGYTIDRWTLTGTGGSMDVQDDGVLLTSPGQYATYFTYKVPSEIVSNLAGKQICLSALWGDDTGYGGSLNIYFDDKWSNYVEITANDLNRRVLTVPDGVKSIYVNFGANGAGTCKIKAAKLELGSHQTLAHQEGGKWALNEIPNYAEQLARCQRYQLTLGNNSCCGYAESATLAYMFVPLPVTMRTTPAFSGRIQLYPVDGNTVTSTSVISASSNMVCIGLAGTGFAPGKAYSAYIVSGILDANL